MANINTITSIVDVFYKIKKGILIEELYALCNLSAPNEVDAKVIELIDAEQIKWHENKLVPFETI